MSLKRFRGWEPVTTVIREKNRIIGYQHESEWDETERAWMLGLAAYEASLCPLCGLPTSYCHDPQREFDVHATVERCFITDQRLFALEQIDGGDNPPPRQGAQTTSITIDN